MITRAIRWGGLAFGGLMLVGLLAFGHVLPRLIGSLAYGMQGAVEEAMPVEFELQRARELLERMMPEVRAKIRRVAHEEVEIVVLRRQIARNERRLAEQARKLQALRDEVPNPSTGHPSVQELQRLNLAFQAFKEGQTTLTTQHELLRVREESLRADLEMLERHRSRRLIIARKVESLAAQHRLIKSRSAQEERQAKRTRVDAILADVEQRVEVARRILDHERRLLPEEPIVILDRSDLLSEVDRYLSGERTMPSLRFRRPEHSRIQRSKH